MNAKFIKEVLSSIFEKNKDKVAFAYLFGSVAQEDPYPLSDIDIAVFLSGELRKSYSDTKVSLHADFSRALKRNDIDVVLLNTTDNIVLLDEIIRHGVVLYDGDRELRVGFEQKILHRAIDFKGQRFALMGM